MVSKYKMIEDAIFNAIIAFNKGFYPTPIAIVKAYNIIFLI